MLIKYIVTITLLVLVEPFIARAQMTSVTRVYGDNDQDIATPVHSSNTTSDSTALQLLVTFIQGSGLSGWNGMTANGRITLPGDLVSHTAKLLLLGGTQSRLDITLDSGTQSTILNGARGVFLDTAGTPYSISSDIATTGLVAFPRFLSAGYPTNASIVTDRGTTTVNGAVLRRITLDDPALDGAGNPWKTEDLYFDPNSGKLMESVAPVHLSTSNSSLYMLETSYTDYQTLGSGGSATAPFTIRQSLNGQLQWTLTLTQANVSTLPPASSFDF